jgi:RNA polymerase sigma-70 factor (sigma-E family)
VVGSRAASGRGALAFIGRSERENFEKLYRRHSRDTRRLAYLLTGSWETAEDLTQDAFIRAFGRLAHLRNQQAFGPYLQRTVVNLARMHYRRRAVERRFLAARAGERPHHTSERSVGSDELEVALARLPYRQRAAVVLRFYCDLSDAEMGTILGCATGTVRSLISRGVATLRDEIGGDRLG